MARPRLTHRPLDMVLSIAVIMVPIVLISMFFTRKVETPINPVDPAPVAAQARAEAGYGVLAPTGLPEPWVSTRATWEKGSRTWTNGWLTPDRMYVEVVQRPAGLDALVADATRSGAKEGTRQVEGREWEQYRSPDGRTGALALRASDVATVVYGDVTADELASFAATLR